MARKKVFAVTYVHDSEEKGAKFWLERVGWQPNQ